MAYYIGIDGGGSKTKAVLCDESLNVIYESQSGPSNFLTIGVEEVSQTILELINDCCISSNISHSDLDHIVLGTTGAGRVNDAKKLERTFIRNSGTLDYVINVFTVVSDARIALEGAFNGDVGSILIAGTGSIMFGKDKKGNVHRVGGYGRLIGDEGSGLTIGRQGLNLIAKFYDGRGKETILTDKVEKIFNISNEQQLISSVYNDDLAIQSIAPLVMESVEEGDQLCKEILDHEIDELLLHIMAMRQKLNEEKMKIVFIGGTISSANIYSKILIEKINLFLPNIQIMEAEYPPEVGAVILAKQNL